MGVPLGGHVGGWGGGL